MKTFEEETMPVLDYFDHKGQLITVNGGQKPNEVLEDALELMLHTNLDE